MASEIKDKFSDGSGGTSSAAFTITIASLASSTTFVGRQTTMVDNSSNRFGLVHIFGKFKLGTSPTSNKAVYVYAIRGDKNATPHRSDNAGASDAALTRLNAPFVCLARSSASAATGDSLFCEDFFANPGPEFGAMIYHDTGVALDSTGSNHWLRWVGNNPEAQ